MDFNKVQEIMSVAEKQRELASQYAEYRSISAKAKNALEIHLVDTIESIREKKKNVGIEMAYLFLLELKPDLKPIYIEWKEAEAKYKGIERILEANASLLMFYQSVMKYQKEGEKWG